MKKVLIVFALFMSSAASFAVELVEFEALNGKVVLQVPKKFAPMSTEMLNLKFPSSRRPTEALSDETGSVSVVFNHTGSAMRPSDLKAVYEEVSKSFHNIYPSATWIRDEIIEQNGQGFMVLELVTPAIDTKIHNIIYGTSVSGRFLIVSFNTTVELSDPWVSIGNKIMASLRVVD